MNFLLANFCGYLTTPPPLDIILSYGECLEVKCMLNHCMEWDKWVLTNFDHDRQWFNTLMPPLKETAAVTVDCISRLNAPLRLIQRYTTPDIRCRDRQYVWNGGIRGNIIRTALCWIVWHNVHSQQHTYMSSSYRSNRLGLSHWDLTPCIDLYYCNMVEWFWWDWNLISSTNWFPSVLWHCRFGYLACKNRPGNNL